MHRIGQLSSIYRDSLFPRTEYAEAWKVLQRDLLRRDACRRMVDLLFIAHEQACEVELAHLLALDLGAGQVLDPKALTSQLARRRCPPCHVPGWRLWRSATGWTGVAA
ncbi:hypothetical protein GCM10011363_45000 [Marivita lacus]|uniref:Uncharacterized protein n=1 Tax=Marivita lacus TaxID=1323742 RepID=A0ABQ1LI49_9RHOB|nr:hypothetical protein GCM10011363_45000 [Marivita lacus]